MGIFSPPQETEEPQAQAEVQAKEAELNAKGAEIARQEAALKEREARLEKREAEIAEIEAERQRALVADEARRFVESHVPARVMPAKAVGLASLLAHLKAEGAKITVREADGEEPAQEERADAFLREFVVSLPVVATLVEVVPSDGDPMARALPDGGRSVSGRSVKEEEALIERVREEQGFSDDARAVKYIQDHGL